ncbi:MAG: hypothetical protein AAB554_04780 [Patescibacteria group bacterium]
MKRLRRNDVIHERQSEFSPILFDVLFGLLIFLGIDSFLGLRDAAHVAFYLASMAVILHWWLKYKAADDAYGLEVNGSTLDLLFGICEIALLQMAMLSAAQADYATAIAYFAMPLVLESVWAVLWRFFGTWRHSSAKRARYLEQELDYTIFLNLGTAFALGVIIVLSPLMTVSDLILSFVLAYFIYIALTHRYEIIDVKLL